MLRCHQTPLTSITAAEDQGVESIGLDEETKTLRSHLMDNHGSNFVSTRDIEDDTLRIWFGDKGSDNFYQGTFSEDGNTNSGRWQWPEVGGRTGGYASSMSRVS